MDIIISYFCNRQNTDCCHFNHLLNGYINTLIWISKTFEIYTHSIYFKLWNIGYIGCYSNNIAIPDFTSFASHLDPTQLTPSVCSKACFAINYQLAGIQDGTMCFCKKSNLTSLTATLNLNCQQIACTGDSTLGCGGIGYWMIYQSLNSGTPPTVY